MSEEIGVDREFIAKWHPQYDTPQIGGKYEVEYRRLIEDVPEEISHGLLSRSTFLRILDWKAPRVKGIIDWDRFTEYQKGIAKAHSVPEGKKLQALTSLYGVGVPVASTILHFMYPSLFPIMDVRTAEALCHLKYLCAKSRTPANYGKFREIMLSLARQNDSTLREVDRALFAYHKIELKGSGSKRQCKR
jgi:hypothetical protein